MNTLTLTQFQWKAWQAFCDAFGFDAALEVLVIIDNSDANLGTAMITVRNSLRLDS